MGSRWSLGLAMLLLATGSGWAAPAHPRIFITAEELPRLRAMARDEAKNALGYVPADAWKALQEKADRFADAGPYRYRVNVPGREGAPSMPWEYTFSKEPPPRHDDSRHYPIWTAMFQERADSITTRLQYFTAAYVVTQEPRYLEKAKEIVLSLCAWPGIWTDPSYASAKPCLDTGHAATWVGIFYDWCYDALTEDERRIVRTALVEKALAPIDGYIDSVSPYHNFTAVIATGLCIGAIALLDEEERARGWIDHAIARIQLNFDAQGKDGGAMEGPMYGTYAADNIADMIWALTTAGISTTLTEHPYLKTLPRYCVTLLNTNNHQQPCFGDGGPGAGFARLMLTLALRGDTDAAWYCEKANYLRPESIRLFLALDPAKLKPKQPSYNPSGCFVDVGYAILRDGYNSGSAFLGFKCGPPEAVVGHNHFDHNSFMINYAGEWIAWDPGYRSYFNPPERRYTSGTLGHNSILLDLDAEYLKSQAVSTLGRDQVRLNKARIAEFFTSNAFDYVQGEAAEAYNSDKERVLDRFDRQVLFVKPRLFFIRDTLAAPKPHTFSSLLHLATGGEFQISGDRVDGIGGQSALQAHVFSPAGIRYTTASYPGAEQYGPYLAATTGRTAATSITTVLVPRRQALRLANGGFEKGMAGWRPRSVPGFAENHVIDTEVKHGGNASGRIDRGGYYYSHLFTVPPGTRITARWWAKCTAPKGASSLFYYWRGGKAFASKSGPAATGNEWREYTLTDVVPEGTEEICLALQFFGDGQCWYDDVELTANLEVPNSAPAKVTPLQAGSGGAVAEVDGILHVLLCGQAGVSRRVEAAGKVFEADAEVAVISLKPTGPEAFLVRGEKLLLDGKPVVPAQGEWRLRRE
jgi:hypothetical protein